MNKVLSEYLFSILLGICLAVELLGHMFNFLRNYQTGFHSLIVLFVDWFLGSLLLIPFVT